MSDIIHLLPDSVANQIAAGEVIQRPASVIKELVENAIDAGATEVEVLVKDAGRTLIQVLDNGIGMSETDARLAFERHATSKIREANDLFSIRTMGFRGEALASIAAVAQVELKSRKKDAELGVHIEISGSKVEKQEPVSCPQGSNFIIKNLFFNIPARRKFLKTNATELRHIISEFQRIALANPQVGFSLSHNEQPLLNLASSNLRQRVVNVMGKSINSHLIPVEIDSSVITISGFIGKPEGARKTAGDQYFFVNNRYMRHPYLNRAVTAAYDNLIAHDAYPSYFLFLEISPELIDVNIHPTKTEIKFEDEKLIWKVLNAAVRESLGKFNVVPSIDFDTEGQVHIPISDRAKEVRMPEVKINPDYNPFNSGANYTRSVDPVPKNWDALYQGFESESGIGQEERDDEKPQTILLSSKSNHISEELPSSQPTEMPELSSSYFQIKNRYILTPVKSGLMVIEQRRAHERVLYERFLAQVQTKKSTTQHLLFAEKLTFNAEDTALLREMKDDLALFGFDLKEQDGVFEVNGIPSEFENVNSVQVLENLLQAYKTGELDPEREVQEQLAAIMARNGCMKSGEILSNEEMNTLISRLFTCKMPHFSPSGHPIISIIENDELEKRFR